ncbi:MAG TPA: 50S ribosomal protein L11 methyltransferase [Candidatus Eremiobacteraceae bacterium]
MSAPQSWRRFSVLVLRSDIDFASALLATATGASVAVEEPGEDDQGSTSHVCVSAYVHSSTSQAAARAVSALLARARRDGYLRSARPQKTVTVRDEDWAESWKRFYKPFAVAPRLWIAPSWEPDFRAPRGAQTLWIDPGMAFGTGQHPTTVLALRMLLPLVVRGCTVIDVGCGSGILGIAAGLAGARVRACDVDPVAIAAARANFRANDVRPDSIRTAGAVPAAFGRAPLVVANITADVLVRITHRLSRCLAKNGTLITSGVTRRGRKAVLAAFEAEGMRLRSQRRAGEWFAFAHRKA